MGISKNEQTAGAMGQRSKSPSVVETCNRFLNAAEQVYIEHGYHGTGIRAIAKLADRNIGTLHHYWGTKQALFEELLERRFRPLSEHHTAHFQRLKDQAKTPQDYDLREILHVLVEPFFLEPQDVLAEKNIKRLYARVLNDPAKELSEAMNRIFEKPVKVFIELLHGVSPHLSNDEFRIRLQLAFNAAVFQDVFPFEVRMGQFLEQSAIDEKKRVEYIINFLMAGLTAARTPDIAELEGGSG